MRLTINLKPQMRILEFIPSSSRGDCFILAKELHSEITYQRLVNWFIPSSFFFVFSINHSPAHLLSPAVCYSFSLTRAGIKHNQTPSKVSSHEFYELSYSLAYSPAHLLLGAVLRKLGDDLSIVGRPCTMAAYDGRVRLELHNTLCMYKFSTRHSSTV